jgi:hypothetical protein
MNGAVAIWLPTAHDQPGGPVVRVVKAFIGGDNRHSEDVLGLHGRIKRRQPSAQNVCHCPPPHCPALALRIPRAARSSRALRVRRALLPRVEDCERLRNTRRSIAERRGGGTVRYSVVRKFQPAFSTIGLAFRRAMMASSSSGSPVVPSKVATSSTSSSFSSSASISFTG